MYKVLRFSEEAAAQYMEISAQPPLKTTKHRHSVHSSNVHQLQISASSFEKANRSNGQFLKNVSFATAHISSISSVLQASSSITSRKLIPVSSLVTLTLNSRETT